MPRLYYRLPTPTTRGDPTRTEYVQRGRPFSSDHKVLTDSDDLRAMQYPRDWFAKMLLFGAADVGCDVHLEEPVTPEVLAIDAWIEPRPHDRDALTARGSIGRMCAEPSVIEVFHPDASMEDIDWAMLRVTLLHDTLRRRADRTEGSMRRTMPPRPRLWVICTAQIGRAHV